MRRHWSWERLASVGFALRRFYCERRLVSLASRLGRGLLLSSAGAQETYGLLRRRWEHSSAVGFLLDPESEIYPRTLKEKHIDEIKKRMARRRFETR